MSEGDSVNIEIHYEMPDGTRGSALMPVAPGAIGYLPAGALLIPPPEADPLFTPFEQGERRALLELRSFIIKHGVKEVDAYAAQRLGDIRMDAEHRRKKEQR